MSNGPMGIVTPAEFRKRTALRLSSRSTSTKALDTAYDAYYAMRSTQNAATLYGELAKYRDAHGGAWNKCERNAVSGGLLEYLYEAVRPKGGLTPAQAQAKDALAARHIDKNEIPHARFGVLYFLANVKLEIDAAGMLMDTASAIGQTIGAGMTTNFGNLGDAKNGVRSVLTVAGQGVQAADIANGGGMILKPIVSNVVNSQPTPGSVFDKHLPNTVATLEAAAGGLSEVWNAQRYLSSRAIANAGPGRLSKVGAGATTVASGVGAAVASTAMVGLAVPATALALLADAGRFVWNSLKKAFNALRDALMLRWRQRYDAETAQLLGNMLKKGIVFAMDQIMKNAVPFLGGAIDIGTGLARTITDAASRIASWMDRRHIRIQEGHPTEMANAIEHQMTLGIANGLGDILMGVGKAAISMYLPALGTLASAAVATISWLVKFFSRLAEQFAIEKFLLTARSHYATEKGQAIKKQFADRGDKVAHYIPNLARDTILTNTDKFTEWFRSGCKASPLIPMLMLNSGLGGSLMTMVKLFDADGAQSTTLHDGRKEFDIADEYFTRLKRFGVRYMKDSGFDFKPLDPADASIKGYLEHATGSGKIRRSHVEAIGIGGRMVEMARG